MLNFQQTSFLFGANAVFIEELYQLYLQDNQLVSADWREFFNNFASDISSYFHSTATVIDKDDQKDYKQQKAADNIKEKDKQVINNSSVNHSVANVSNSEAEVLKVKSTINTYRQYGHYLANLDPLSLDAPVNKKELMLDTYSLGWREEEMENLLQLPYLIGGKSELKVKELLANLDSIYTNHIAVEFNQVRNKFEQEWLYEQIENQNITFKKEVILSNLLEVELFEQYLHTKFPGSKRFSIEGGESAVAALEYLVQIAPDCDIEDITIGMAHRGRLSTLTKVVGKPYNNVFAEFLGHSILSKDLCVQAMNAENKSTGMHIDGDVKYHMGYLAERIVENGKKVTVSILPNPSHLEAIDPVVAGVVRAKQDYGKDKYRKKSLAILVHGDAAFCGQGVVAETVCMSALPAYNTGGVVHLVINNQIGFTANSSDTRCGRYPTGYAHITGSPILHVNGDDVEAVLAAVNIAINYRQKFSKDIVVDIFCYRKYGHNEGDEPMYTQGKMYNVIRQKKTPAKIYADLLVNQKIIDNDYLSNFQKKFKSFLDDEYSVAKEYKASYQENLLSPKLSLPTGVEKLVLQELGKKIFSLPENISVNSKLLKLYSSRLEAIANDKDIDWAIAEQLAFASLLNEGVRVRLTGQDCGRGTFSHRHSVLHSQIDDKTYMPLNHLTPNQKVSYEVADSHLSEYAVLGFEYGYSVFAKNSLTIWEAQFGDFANGAQIVFDQFISSAESKWLQNSNLVVLLPHGFEGQGPEHSSARMERFLQLAAKDNMQIVYPTTPSAFFHLLRRQVYSSYIKPLIVMTPKSLLRHKLAVSSLNDLGGNSKFLPLIDEVQGNISASRVILCSGKVYYDLFEARTQHNINNIIIIRVEQLYPLDMNLIKSLLTKYNTASEYIWCQEEPKNMGAWSYIKDYLDNALANLNINNKFIYIGREASASPAVGSLYIHNQQQEEFIKNALKLGE